MFEPATVEEVPTLIAIDAGSPVAWSARAFEAEVRRVPPTLFVARSPRGVEAFVATRIQPPELDIVNLAVDPLQRRRGIGRFMVNRLLTWAASMSVQVAFHEVRESNQAARNLYAGLGFKETRKRKAFYRNPLEDAVMMMRKIEP
jgi:ribosomal-protein-alanine N-acetyltransferase